MKKLFNLKRLLKKRNNGGFTLVEVVISCALLGILVVGVVSFMAPVMSMVQMNQKNARATMLAEALDVYISGCLRNARKVEVFTNTSVGEVTSSGIYGTSAEVSGGKLNLTLFMSAGNNYDLYEIRCLGITWEDDEMSPVTGRKKLIVTNCKVEMVSDKYNNDLRIKDIQKVFDDSMYDGLYPVITLETFKTQNDDGSPGSYAANGYKISSKIFADPDCYDITSDAARENTTLAFEGVTYVECTNMKTKTTVDGEEKRVPEPASAIRQVRKDQKEDPSNPDSKIIKSGAQTAIESSNSSDRYSIGSKTYYYPSTFIYYIVPK